jgi:hypothetical protein
MSFGTEYLWDPLSRSFEAFFMAKEVENVNRFLKLSSEAMMQWYLQFIAKLLGLFF